MLPLTPQLRKDSRQLGVTLIELMIVIGLIAALSAILFPAVSAMRKRSEGVRCIGNLRQVGVATLAYAAEREGKMLYYYYDKAISYERWWRTELAATGYIKDERIASCPSLLGKNPSKHESYGMRIYSPPKESPEAFTNSNMKGELVKTYIHFRRMAEPSKYPLYVDSVQPKDASVAARAGKQWHRFSVDPIANGGAGVHLRHSNRANVWFCDGHVKSLSGEELAQVGILSGFDIDATRVSFQP